MSTFKKDINSSQIASNLMTRMGLGTRQAHLLGNALDACCCENGICNDDAPDTFVTFVENTNDYTFTSADTLSTIVIPKDADAHNTVVAGNNITVDQTVELDGSTTFTVNGCCSTYNALTNELTISDALGADVVIPVGGTSSITNTVAGHLIATHDDGEGTIVEIDETITTLVDNLDGTHTFTNEDGTTVTFNNDVPIIVNSGTTALATDDSLGTATINGGDTIHFWSPTNTLGFTVVDGSAIVSIDLPLSGDANNSLGFGTDGRLFFQETVTSISYVVGTKTLTYNDEDGNPTNIVLDGSVSTVTNVIAGNRIATHDDGDGNTVDIDETITELTYNALTHDLTYTKEDGLTNVINLNNPGLAYNQVTNILTHTAPDTTVTNIDLSGLSNPSVVTNVIAGNRIATHTDSNGLGVEIDESITTVVDNNDGTFTYTAEGGGTTIIDICNIIGNCAISALSDVDTTGAAVSDVLNWNGTNWVPTAPLQFGEYQAPFDATVGTFPGGALVNQGDWFNATTAGTVDGQVFASGDILIAAADNPSTTVYAGSWTVVPHPGAITSVITNTQAGNLIATHNDGNGTSVAINETVTSAALNADNINVDYVDENGNTTQLDLTALVANLESDSTLTYNAATNVLTYTPEDGVAVTITLTSPTLAYNAVTNVITHTAPDGTVTTITLDSSTVTNVIAGNRIATHTGADGTIVDIDETITSIGLNADNINIDYVAEDGNTTQLNLTALVSNLETTTDLTYTQATNTLTHTDEDGTVTNIVLGQGALTYNAVTNVLTYTDSSGTVTNVTLDSSVVTNTIAGNRIATHTSADGTAVDIDETITSAALNADNINLDYIAEDGNTTQLNLTNLVGNLETDTTLAYNAATHVLTYTPEDGTAVNLTLDVGTLAYAAATNILTYTAPDGTVTNVTLDSSVITNVIAGNRIATHTAADGTAVDIDETITTLVDNADGTFTYTNETGATTIIAHNRIDNTLTAASIGTAPTDGAEFGYDPATGATYYVTAGNVWAAVPGGAGGSTSVITNAIAGNRIATHNDGGATTVDIDETITALAYNATTNVLTYSKEGGATDVITLDNPTISYIAGTQILTYTAADGTVTNIDLSGLADVSSVTNTIAVGNLIATHTNSDATVTNINETVTTAALNADNVNIDYTDENGNTTQLDLTNLIANLEADTTLAYNATAHTLTYTPENGVAVVLTLDNPTLAYNVATNVLTHTAPDGTVTNLTINSSVVNNLIAGHRIATHTGANGTAVDIDETITTLVNNNDGTFTYTNEDGASLIFNVCTELDNCSISALGDVDTTGVSASQILSWNNTTSTFEVADPLQFGEYQAAFDASGVVFPTTTTAGDWYNISTAGTVDGQVFAVGDILVATVDNPSTGTFAGNWTIVPHPGAITSVITNTVAGNRIATHADGNGTNVDIDETITSVAYNAVTSTLTYNDEAGTANNLVLSDTNLFTGDYINTALRVQTDDFGWNIIGDGAKVIQSDLGTVLSQLIVQAASAVLAYTDGTGGSATVTATGTELGFTSSTGEFTWGTNIPVDSDDATSKIMTITNGGSSRLTESARFESLIGAGAPVDNTDIAWFDGQIYIDSTTGKSYYAVTASTDPDVGAAGSVWAEVCTTPCEPVTLTASITTDFTTGNVTGFETGTFNCTNGCYGYQVLQNGVSVQTGTGFATGALAFANYSAWEGGFTANGGDIIKVEFYGDCNDVCPGVIGSYNLLDESTKLYPLTDILDTSISTSLYFTDAHGYINGLPCPSYTVQSLEFSIDAGATFGASTTVTSTPFDLCGVDLSTLPGSTNFTGNLAIKRTITDCAGTSTDTLSPLAITTDGTGLITSAGGDACVVPTANMADADTSAAGWDNGGVLDYANFNSVDLSAYGGGTNTLVSDEATLIAAIEAAIGLTGVTITGLVVTFPIAYAGATPAIEVDNVAIADPCNDPTPTVNVTGYIPRLRASTTFIPNTLDFDDPQFILPGTIAANIDWGDGSPLEFIPDVNTATSHNYGAAGFYDVVVTYVPQNPTTYTHVVRYYNIFSDEATATASVDPTFMTGASQGLNGLSIQLGGCPALAEIGPMDLEFKTQAKTPGAEELAATMDILIDGVFNQTVVSPQSPTLYTIDATLFKANQETIITYRARDAASNILMEVDLGVFYTP